MLDGNHTLNHFCDLSILFRPRRERLHVTTRLALIIISYTIFQISIDKPYCFTEILSSQSNSEMIPEKLEQAAGNNHDPLLIENVLT